MKDHLPLPPWTCGSCPSNPHVRSLRVLERMTRIVLIIQAIIQDTPSRAFSAVIITSAQHPREGIFLDFFFFSG